MWEKYCTYHGFMRNNGIGKHVKNTVSNKNDLRPQTSDNAPINGAERNDKKPLKYRKEKKSKLRKRLFLYLLRFFLNLELI